MAIDNSIKKSDSSRDRTASALPAVPRVGGAPGGVASSAETKASERGAAVGRGRRWHVHSWGSRGGRSDAFQGDGLFEIAP